MMDNKTMDDKSVPTAEGINGEGEVIDMGQIFSKYGTTKRGLSNRHIQLISIAGSIGTALFVAIGSHMHAAGPLNVLLAFIIYPVVFVLPCYLCVAEMACHLPIKGTIYEMATRFVDPAFGFMLGWSYFYGAVMLLCAELSAVATVMTYWSDINPALWIAMALAVVLFLNIFAVKWYGESEFFFACTKVLLILGLIILTFITMVGGNPKHDVYGFRHWKESPPMHEYYTTGTTGRFLGWWSCVLYAAFSFGGPDLLAMAAGEIKDPRRNIPRVARNVFYRVFLFYVLGALAVGTICSSNDPRLVSALKKGSKGAAASPWVIGIQNLGIEGLPSFINAAILLSGWSCANAYLYSSSRTLYSLAVEGQAPRIFLTCTKSGVPIYCVGICALISCITFLVSSHSASEVFGWFIDLTVCSFDIAYTCMTITWVCWARALKAQGVSRDSLHYKAPFMPYAAYLSIGSGIVILIFIGWHTFHPWSTQGFITSYFGVPYAFIAFFVWKILKKTKFVDPKKADIWTGKAEVDEECKVWEEAGEDEVEKKSTKLLPRLWNKLW